MTRAQSETAGWRDRSARALLFFYKRVAGPAMHAVAPGACRFQPTCSEYAAIAIAEYGVLRGGCMAAWRILRCNPLNRLRDGGGFDPVPARVKEPGTLAAQGRL